VASRGSHETHGGRIYFLDNLRTIAILLVVLYHVGGVYESSGIWSSFWIVDDPSTNDLVGVVNVILDMIVMPAMFLVSGYLTPRSLADKGAWQFVATRFKRLILPWLAAVLVLIPVYKVIFLYSRGLPQEHWTSYFHFTNGIWGQAWLWFLPVLFLFDVVYLLLSKANLAPTRASLKLTLVAMVVVGFVMSLAMDVLSLEGWTKTLFIDFQNERLLIYFMAFLFGSLCAHKNVFASRPNDGKLYAAANVFAWIPIGAYVALLLIPIVRPGAIVVSPLVHHVLLWFSFYLALVSLLYLLVSTFWRYFDRPGQVWSALNRNSYYVYIIHVIVLGAIAALLLDSDMPSLLKYGTVALTAYLLSNAIAWLYRQAVRRGARTERRDLARV